MNKKILLWIFLACFSVVLVGCESAVENTKKSDQWIRDNVW